MRKALIIVLLFLFAIPFLSRSQDEKAKLVQLSGFVMTSDSLMGIPYCHIYIQNGGSGTVSDFDGYFSFVAKTRDTIVFSAVGFEDDIYIVPTKLKGDKYSVIKLMTEDTVFLPETIIYPWPSKEFFRNAFLSADVPDDALEKARKNLERERLKELGEAMVMDADENTDYHFRENAKEFYYAGQVPPMNIFNPLAWAEFFKAWKNGDFKSNK
ncbi:MAG: carboxypeptidase-like regulatory domain-containing protein [Chitinophagales bacterium]|nr:carboxypeptidase-like regulatory domain-containing protein [Chitinophagales bacterium]